jgi:membrane protein implicated in regulation of membrane protease activity
VEEDAGRVRYGLLTFALMGGATAWLLRLVINSSLVAYSCRIGSTWPLWLSTGLFTAVGLLSLWASWRLHRGRGEQDAVTWLGLLGVMFNVTSVAGIVLESVPIAVIDLCRAV